MYLRPYVEAHSPNGRSHDLLVLRGVELLQILLREELGKNILADGDENEEGKREKDSGNWDPGHPEAKHQVRELEYCEPRDVLEWHRLHEHQVGIFQHPAKRER